MVLLSSARRGAFMVILSFTAIMLGMQQKWALDTLEPMYRYAYDASATTMQAPVIKSPEWTILMTVNDGFLDFMLNWLWHYNKLGLKIPIVAIAQDDKVYSKLQLLSMTSDLIRIQNNTQNGGSASASGALKFGSKHYKALVSERATHLIPHLRRGVNVLYTDVDTVWRSDPFEYINAPQYKDADMLIQVDAEEFKGISPYFCTGFMAIRANEKTINFMLDWESALQVKKGHNQPVFNKLLLNSSSVKYMPLPLDRFPSGELFFDKMTPSQRTEVAVVHNNYIKGHKRKQERFVKHNLWHLA